MPFLDTTVFVDLGGRGGAKRKAEAQALIRQLLLTGEMLHTSRINLAELYVGMELSRDPAREKAVIDNYLTWVAILEFDDRAARNFGRIRADLQLRGKLVGDMDMLIAATALANGESVVTRNPAHFAGIPGLILHAYGK